MDVVQSYLVVGILFYVYMAISRRRTFKNANYFSLARGVAFGVLLWPIAMIYVWHNK